jgi:hypothetical protein
MRRRTVWPSLLEPQIRHQLFERHGKLIPFQIPRIFPPFAFIASGINARAPPG